MYFDWEQEEIIDKNEICRVEREYNRKERQFERWKISRYKANEYMKAHEFSFKKPLEDEFDDNFFYDCGKVISKVHGIDGNTIVTIELHYHKRIKILIKNNNGQHIKRGDNVFFYKINQRKKTSEVIKNNYRKNEKKELKSTTNLNDEKENFKFKQFINKLFNDYNFYDITKKKKKLIDLFSNKIILIDINKNINNYTNSISFSIIKKKENISYLSKNYININNITNTFYYDEILLNYFKKNDGKYWNNSTKNYRQTQYDITVDNYNERLKRNVKILNITKKLLFKPNYYPKKSKKAITRKIRDIKMEKQKRKEFN